MQVTYDELRSTIVANLGIDHTLTGDLLQMYFSGDTEPDNLSAFFSKYDIELLEYQCVWLVSKLSSRLHYEGVPKEQFPRIKGVVKKFTVENARLFCVLSDIVEALNNAGIAVMLLNGAAMKAFYEPAETRYQRRINVLVHAGDIKRAGLILEKRGFRLQGAFWGQRFYQENDVIITVHSTYLPANVLTGDLADIWQQSRATNWRGEKVFVPCPEMMLLILLVQGLENSCSCISNSQANSFVNDFLDIKFFLTNASLRCDTFISLAKKSKLALHARLMLDVLNQLYPDTVPVDIMESLPYSDKDLINVQGIISYNVLKKQMADAGKQHNRMGYYHRGIGALWNLNCYYGNRSSFFSDILGFPLFIVAWAEHRGMKGLFSKLGGYRK